jgi:DNA-binding SARP family transcriptional activator/DNA polymerase III delta prime subunit
MPRFTLRLLGSPEIVGETGKLVLPTRKLWAMVVYLAAQGRPVERGKLAGLLWDQADEERARGNLRQELYRLRGSPAERLLVVKPDTLALSGHTSDLLETMRCLEQADWEGALARFRGEFAAGLSVRGAPAFEDWLLLEREHWQGLWRGAARKRAKELEAAQPEEAQALLGRILEADPFQEDLQRALLALTAQVEGVAAALGRYERYRALLQREFSLEPLPETLELVERLRRGQTPSAAPSPEAPPPIPQALEHPPLVGREREWGQMEAAWQAGKALYLSGPPGVGKTRLMLEFARSKGRFLLLEGRPGDSGIPYAFHTRALRQSLVLLDETELPQWMRQEIARLVPELAEASPPPITSEDGKLRLLEAITEVIRRLARAGVGIIVADDLQFVTDAASLEVSAYAMARVLPERLSYPIMAFRSEELSPPIREAILQQVERGLAVLIELEPLAPEGLGALVRVLSGSEARLFSQRLYDATGGNPLFALETLKELFASGDLRVEEGVWSTNFDEATEDYRELPLPRSVQAAVNRRVDRLGGAVRRLLEAASLAGEGFGLEELSGATALSEWEALEAAEVAERAGLLRQRPDGLGFAHDLLRRALSEGLSPERRKVLHRKLAETLTRLDGAPARVAEHQEQAGRPKEAVPWRLKAAAAARAVYANREALAHYAKALADGAEGPTAFEVHAARAELYRLLDEQEAWQEELRALEEGARALGDPLLQARAALARAEFERYAGRYDEALGRLEPLLCDPALPKALRARAFFERGQALLTLGRGDEAQKQLYQALRFEPSSLSPLAAEAHLILSDQAVGRGDLAAGQRHAREALAAFEAEGDRRGKGMALRNLGRAVGIGGDTAGAIQILEQALGEAVAAGDVVSQRHILLNLFKFEFETGSLEAALRHLERGRALFGNRPDPLQEGIFLNNLSVLQRMRGEFGLALETLQAALAVAERSGIAQGRARRRMSLVEYYLDLGRAEEALPLLQEAEALIAQAGLDELWAWLQAQYARREVLTGQPEAALARLEPLLAGPFADPHDGARAAWTAGLTWLTLGEPRKALEAVERFQVPPNPPFQARALAVRLEASALLERDTPALIREAEALLAANTVPLLEALELYRAMTRAARPAQARSYRQAAAEQCRKIVASLEGFPEFRAGFLRRYSPED